MLKSWSRDQQELKRNRRGKDAKANQMARSHHGSICGIDRSILHRTWRRARVRSKPALISDIALDRCGQLFFISVHVRADCLGRNLSNEKSIPYPARSKARTTPEISSGGVRLDAAGRMDLPSIHIPWRQGLSGVPSSLPQLLGPDQ